MQYNSIYIKILASATNLQEKDKTLQSGAGDKDCENIGNLAIMTMSLC